MRKTSTVLFTFVVVAFLVFLTLRFDLLSIFFETKPVVHIRLNQPVGDLSKAMPPVSSATSVPEKPAAPAIIANSSRLTPPDAAQVRDEAKKNPHITPPSLVGFAREISQMETDARKSPESAMTFFSDLSDCVEGGNVPQAQALCLTTAREIAGVYPELLHDRYETLLDTAPSEAKKLASDLVKMSH